MAKFDLFDQSTWAPDPVDYEKSITNKAMGHIGQRIHDLNVIRNEISSKLEKEQVDYNIAETLRAKSNDAYLAMQISYQLPDNEVMRIIALIDDILNTWKDVNNRRNSWRSLIPKFKELEPYLKKDKYGAYSYYFEKDKTNKNIEALTDIKVFGNAAWATYRDAMKENASLDKKWRDALKDYLRVKELLSPAASEEEDCPDSDR